MQFLQHNWRNQSDIADLRQEVYVRVCEAAREARPDNTKAFVFRAARNILINRVRREQVVPIEAVADLESLGAAADEPPLDRAIMAREELRRLQLALDHLPPRSREAVVMKQIEGLSRRDIAARMGVGEETVKRHLTNGIREIADILYGEPTDLRKKS
jgi:RNA polymerase sigma-70 factor (ECF subfamily)